jgi:hypothetical protein
MSKMKSKHQDFIENEVRSYAEKDDAEIPLTEEQEAVCLKEMLRSFKIIN